MDGLIYFRDGKLMAESGEVKIYEMNDELFLEIGPGHSLWALEGELEDYIDQLGDKPKGDCLEIGLGLGVASNYMLSFPKVKSLTTIEINKDIIKAYAQIRDRYKSDFHKGRTHRIVNMSGLTYVYRTNKLYDFIFMDFYDIIDEDTLPAITDMYNGCKQTLKPGGTIVPWLDKHTPSKYVSILEGIFEGGY
jgi:spermidine synthase